MNNFVLSATLELKDKMSAGLSKTRYALSGIAGESTKVTKSTDKLKKSLESIKGEHSAILSVKDKAKPTINAVKSSLNNIYKGEYKSSVGITDHATTKISKIKSELNGFTDKTYTAIVNVKNNMPQNGGLNNLKESASGMLFGTGTQMLATAGIGYGVYDAVKSYMDFEKEMSAVKALSGATEEEFTQLTEKAKQMGADTKFSAKESAQAFEYMAQAGWKTGEMLNGIEGIMNLAAASGEDLAMTSDIVTDALTAFGLKAKDSAMFSDVLASAATNSNTNISKMGYTFKYVAPLAGAMGYSIQDMALSIGLMANQGIKGEQAGTSLRGILTAMVSPTKDSATAMDMLGVSLTDASGKAKPFREVLNELRAGFSKLDPIQKNNVASMLAGQEGMSGLLALVNASEEDFNKLAGSIDNSTGAAKKMAAIRMDNLAGDLEYLSGDWDALVMKLTSGSASSGLRSLVKEVDDILQTFSNSIDDGLQFTDVLETIGKVTSDLTDKFLKFDGVGSVLAGGALVGGLVKIIKLLNKTKSGISEVFESFKNIKTPKTALETGVESAGNSSVSSMTVNATNVVVNGKNGTQNSGGDVSVDTSNKEPTKTSKPATKKGKFSTGAKWAGEHLKGLGKSAVGIGALIGAYDIYSAGEGKRAETVGNVAGGLAGGVAGAKVGAMAGGAIGSVVPVVGTVAGAGIGGAIGGIAGGIFGGDIGSSIASNIDFSQITSSLTTAFTNTKTYILDTMSAIGLSVRECILTPISNIGIDVLNIFVGAFAIVAESVSPYISQITNLFQPLADVANNTLNSVSNAFDVSAQYVSSVWNGVVGTFNSIWDSISSGANNAYSNIVAYFSSAGSAVSSVWYSVLSTFSGIYNSISTGASYVYSAITSAFSSAASYVKSIWSGITGFFDGIWSNISSKVSSIANKFGSLRAIGSGITGLDHNATGTMSFAGGLTEINEQGGEIIDLPTGSRIYPAQTTANIIKEEMSNNNVNNGQATPTINITGNNIVIKDETDMEKFADIIASKFIQASNGFGGAY